MLRVMLDLDEIVVSCLAPWIAAYNVEHGENMTMDDITDYDFNKVGKPGVDMFKYIRTPGFFRYLPFLPGALEGIKRMSDLKFENGSKALDIVVCTAASYGNQAGDKMDWFKDNLGKVIGKRNILVGPRKEWLDADVFIDDSPKNHRLIRAKHPNAAILTIAYKHNKATEHLTDLRVGSHAETQVAWDAFVVFVKELVRLHDRVTL